MSYVRTAVAVRLLVSIRCDLYTQGCKSENEGKKTKVCVFRNTNFLFKYLLNSELYEEIADKPQPTV